VVLYMTERFKASMRITEHSVEHHSRVIVEVMRHLNGPICRITARKRCREPEYAAAEQPSAAAPAPGRNMAVPLLSSITARYLDSIINFWTLLTNPLSPLKPDITPYSPL